MIVTTKRTLKSLATRIRSLSFEIDEHDETLKGLINVANPSLLQTRGIGVVSAAALLISAGDNPDRLASEEQFAMHTGAAPIPASSGQTMRYRLNRGGDRKANHALHTIAIVRLHTCPRTRSYAVRRKSEGKSPKDILRCLKRAIAREVYHLLTTPPEYVDPGQLRQLRLESGCTLTEAADSMGCNIAKLSCAERGVLNDREFLGVYRAHLEQQNTAQSAA